MVPSGNATVYDGFHLANQSTFTFATGQVQAWGAPDSDLGVANPHQGDNPASFFLANNHYPYTNLDPQATHQEQANAGIVEAKLQSFERVMEAPATGYVGNYFDPLLSHVYCVRTRDGKHFAKILITDVQKDRISFDYVFQPDGTRSFIGEK